MVLYETLLKASKTVKIISTPPTGEEVSFYFLYKLLTNRPTSFHSQCNL